MNQVKYIQKSNSHGGKCLIIIIGVARIFSGGGTLFQKIFKNISKIFNKIHKKIAKNGFLAYFSKNLTNPAFHVCAFGRKTLFAENFFKEKIFLRKLRKMHYFRIFFKKFRKPSIQFLRVWTKNDVI